MLTSPYGVTWMAAILLAVGVAAFEGARLSPVVAKLIAAGGPEQIEALDQRLAGYGRIELGGFLVLFSMMIAMRFGY